jgi:hypothetical protein
VTQEATAFPSTDLLLDRDQAEKIINDMKALVDATWYDTVRASGVSKKNAEMVAKKAHFALFRRGSIADRL